MKYLYHHQINARNYLNYNKTKNNTEKILVNILKKESGIRKTVAHFFIVIV